LLGRGEELFPAVQWGVKEKKHQRRSLEKERFSSFGLDERGGKKKAAEGGQRLKRIHSSAPMTKGRPLLKVLDLSKGGKGR